MMHLRSKFVSLTENLTTAPERGDCVSSPVFTCFDRQWRLNLYPFGNWISNDGMVGLHLAYLSEEDINVHFEFRIDNDTRGGIDIPFSGRCSSGWENFESRSNIITRMLDDGALTVEIRMSQIEPADQSLRHFVPPNQFPGGLRKTFNCEKYADVLFVVGGQELKHDGHKKAKVTPNQFHAHRLILRQYAPTLADICDMYKDDKHIEINDVRADLFELALKYVYGQSLPKDDLKASAREIIDIADKYGVIGLKLEAEASYVNSTTINMENVIDNLLYANAKNCALLNEAVMDFVVENCDVILDKVSFADVPGDVVSELLAQMVRDKKSKNCSPNIDPMDLNMMRVSTLRKLCHDKGLDFDGSRKTMIGLLKSAQEQNS